MAINRGKQSVALDLKAPDDLACMKALLEEADVFVLNVRGKAVERLGLDYDAVRGDQSQHHLCALRRVRTGWPLCRPAGL